MYFFQPFSVGKGPLALRPEKPLSEKEGVDFVFDPLLIIFE